MKTTLQLGFLKPLGDPPVRFYLSDHACTGIGDDYAYFRDGHMRLSSPSYYDSPLAAIKAGEEAGFEVSRTWFDNVIATNPLDFEYLKPYRNLTPSNDVLRCVSCGGTEFNELSCCVNCVIGEVND